MGTAYASITVNAGPIVNITPKINILSVPAVAGPYSVMVTDSNGCISNPSPIFTVTTQDCSFLNIIKKCCKHNDCVTFAITVTNTGIGAAQDVVVTDTFTTLRAV